MFKVIRQKLQVSNSSISTSTKFIVNDRMRDMVSHSIVELNVLEEKHEFHKEYSIELIVATERDFFEAVKKYSDRMSRGIPTFLEDMEKLSE